MNDHDLLIRIDERTEAMAVSMKDLKDYSVKRMNHIEDGAKTGDENRIKHEKNHHWKTALISGTIISAAIFILIAYTRLTGAG